MLQDAITHFLDPENLKPIRYRRKLNLNPPTLSYVVSSIPEIPSEWALLVGEMLYNARGALDHLTWDLAILNTGSEPVGKDSRRWRTQFPICGREADWDSPRIQKMIEPLSTAHRALIQQFQPYQDWRWDPPEPLMALEMLSNTDKHRALQPVLLGSGGLDPALKMRGRDCEIIGAGGKIFSGVSLDIGTELLRLPIRITGPNPKVNMELKLSGQIAFGTAWHVVPTLASIGVRAEEALLAFEADLSTPTAIELLKRVAAEHRHKPMWVHIDFVSPQYVDPDSDSTVMG